MDGSANGQGDGGGHGIIRIRTDGIDPDHTRRAAPSGGDLRGQIQASSRSSSVRRSPNRRSRVVVFGLVWAVLAVGFTVSWLAGRGHDATTAAAPETTAVSNGVDSGTAETPAAGAPPTTARAPAADEVVAVGILAARDDVWVRAAADGREVQAGVVRHGDRVDVSGRSIDIAVSKPSAVDVTVDSAPAQAATTMHFGD